MYSQTHPLPWTDPSGIPFCSVCTAPSHHRGIGFSGLRINETGVPSDGRSALAAALVGARVWAQNVHAVREGVEHPAKPLSTLIWTKTNQTYPTIPIVTGCV